MDESLPPPGTDEAAEDLDQATLPWRYPSDTAEGAAEREAVTLYGLAARGREGVHAIDAANPELVFFEVLEVQCAHDVSIWDECPDCRSSLESV